jgi:hypothetical protein
MSIEERVSTAPDSLGVRTTGRGLPIFDWSHSRSALTPFGWLALLSFVAAAAVGAILVSAT